MTSKQGVIIASRALAIYLACWAVTDLIEIPRQLSGVIASMRFVPAAADSSYAFARNREVLRTETLFLLESILRVPLWSLLSFFFYQCGPRVQRIFGVDEQIALHNPDHTGRPAS